jgi:hypothetical protein
MVWGDTMTDLPSVRSINNATAPLRQAYELAVQIEALGSFAPEVLDFHKVQFMRQLEQVASHLGFDIPCKRPALEIVRDDGVNGFGR